MTDDIPPAAVDDLFRRRDGSYRVAPASLYPPFLERLCVALLRARERGQDYYATSGLRWFSEQARLHALYVAGKGPRAVAAGYSAHQYGIAVDFAPDADMHAPGLQGPAYDSAHYRILVEETRAAGLKPGADFGDNPHVQVPQFVSAGQLASLRAVFMRAKGSDEEKLRAVWEYLDAHLKLPPMAA